MGGDLIDARLRPAEFDAVRERLRSLTGISLADDKQGLVAGRLIRRLRALGLSSYRAYLDYLDGDRSGAEQEMFVNAMTTNMTSFFREQSQLMEAQDFCAKLTPSETVFIWSAACSTGEEVYSLAMLMEDLRLRIPSFDYRILGTDIDTECLRRAERAVYAAGDLEHLPPGYRENFFSEMPGGAECRVNDSLRRRTKFRPMNLTAGEARSIPLSFHFVFLRNVLIYFEPQTISQVISDLEGKLRSDGTLYLGASEVIDPQRTSLVRVGNSSYRRKLAA